MISDSDSSEHPEDEVSDSSSEEEEEELPGRGRGQPQQRQVRGRGRGRGRGRDRGRGRGGPPPAPAAPPAPAPAPAPVSRSYEDPDTPNQLPPFTPRRPPGLHLNMPLLRGAMTRAVDFFRLFFTAELIRNICTHTNSYGWGAIGDKPYYGDKG